LFSGGSLAKLPAFIVSKEKLLLFFFIFLEGILLSRERRREKAAYLRQSGRMGEK